MQNSIKLEIKRLAKRAFLKNAARENRAAELRNKFEKRTGIPAGLPKSRLNVVKHKHFDPAYCARNANYLAKSLWQKVLTKTYEPVAAINYEIPKPDGGKRSVMAFAIPDAALANVVFRRVRQRNLKRLSPYSYAYHPEKNVFDALLALKGYKPNGKAFAVQIDFEKYFDNIPSSYLKAFIANRDNVSLTPHERVIIEKFLHHKFVPADGSGRIKRRWKGTPQGSSISLFLANIANHELDQTLASSAGVFARFADDIVALSSDYTSALQIEKCFSDHCASSGLKINNKKSPGTGIIADRVHEMRTYNGIEFLGYLLTPEGLTIPEKASNRTIMKISRLVNLYLIQYLAHGFARNRAAVAPHRFDWDLLGLIYELRRVIYGGLSEAEISNFLNAGKKLRRMKGLMGFYCLLDNPEPLKHWDGWLLSIVRRAMVKRNSLLSDKYLASCPTPTNKELAIGNWMDMAAWKGSNYPETRMPSFVRGWRAARKHYFTYGLDDVEPPAYGLYTEFSTFDAYR